MTTRAAEHASFTGGAHAIPGALRTGLRRGRIELKILARNKMELFFTLAFPVLLLVLLSSMLGGQLDKQATRFIITGIVTSGIFTVAFYSLTLRIAAEREDGTLRRLGATPFPKSAYFIGKTCYVAVAGVVGTAGYPVVAAGFYALAFAVASPVMAGGLRGLLSWLF